MDDELFTNPLGDGGGAPKWTVTFADLMSLLLCFFILLLSFSETDPKKYKEVAGSLEQAFGVQRQWEVFKMPVGMKMVARDFDQSLLQVRVSEDYRVQKNTLRKKISSDTSKKKPNIYPKNKGTEESDKKAEADAHKLEQEIKKEFNTTKGEIQVKAKGGDISISLMGGSTFDSGSSDIKPDTASILEKIGNFLKQRDGEIVIAGHTDNIPISNSKFKSNLELSAGRSAAVAQFFISHGIIGADRIATMGFGEHRPLAPNETPEDREKNRRVEILLTKLPEPSKLTPQDQGNQSNGNPPFPHVPALP